MALGSTIYTFEVDLTDVDRGVYEAVELRLACHPSESLRFMLTRLVAYLLNLQEGIGFSAGLGSPDETPVAVTDATGALRLWIDVGNPAPDRIHKAAKAADAVRIYTYKDPEALRRSVAGERVHRADEVELFSLDDAFLSALEDIVGRRNRWSVVHTEGALFVTAGERTTQGALAQHRLID